MSENWLIYRFPRRAWYGPNGNGYFTNSISAGRYTKEEAEIHCRGCNGENEAVQFSSERHIQLLQNDDADRDSYWTFKEATEALTRENAELKEQIDARQEVLNRIFAALETPEGSLALQSIVALKEQLNESRGGHIETKCRKCGRVCWVREGGSQILACNECVHREKDEQIADLEERVAELERFIKDWHESTAVGLIAWPKSDIKISAATPDATLLNRTGEGMES